MRLERCKCVKMNKGILYWITGLSGSGKTTIGNRLYYQIKKKNENIVLLDGDILKKIVGKELGYEREERLERAYRYSALCKLLTDQGINVVICTIAMFDEVRNWNRKNIEKYVEVFLDVELEVLKARNRKGLYSRGNKHIAGIDVDIEYPKSPDIVIKNNGKEVLEEAVRSIIEYRVVCNEKWNHDEDYWNKYYKDKNAQGISLNKPSLFAQYVFSKYMKTGKELVELGCGNGRDSLYFADRGLNVTGIDASQVAIKELQQKNTLHNCMFICDDFVNVESIYQIQYDYCYSRFTLHAISEYQETQILLKAYDMLKADGYLFVETRSINDGKYGLGQAVEKNAFINDGHYRRFIDLVELVTKVTDIGFKVIEQEESNEFAPYKNEDAVCIRLIAQR